MMPLILPLSDPTATLESVGGKGLSLAKMLAAGLPVPDGFHVTTAAYRRFVAANGLQAAIPQALAGLDPTDSAALEAAAQRIAALFAAGQIPPEVAEAVAAAYAALHDAPVAVRSSATAEDLPEASFAGQQETYLNLRGADAVQAAVQRCWASLWTARAIAYRLKNHIDQEAVALAVVIQELVPADAAGILFTANPLNGHRDELLINAAWGLGEAVVSSAVTPDTLTVSQATGKVLHRKIADKAVMTVRTAQGTEEVSVPAERRRQAVLSAAQTAELARLGAHIEQFYQRPMDVEWALADGRVYIVQARPITALPPEWRLPDPQALFSRSSLAEHIPSPVTPLFATLGLRLANQATLPTWERYMGRNAQAMAPTGGIYQVFNGYVFLGVRTGGGKIFNLLKMSLSQIGPILRNSVPRWRAAHDDFVARVRDGERQPVETMTPAELLGAVRAVFGAACRYYTDIQTTLPAASTSEVLFTRFYDRLVKRRQDPAAEVFLLGSETLALRAEKSLFDLAEWARERAEIEYYLSQTSAAELATHLSAPTPPAGLPAELWAVWRQRIQRHLDEYGRTAYEFDFANPTPFEAPEPLLETVQAYLSEHAASPYQRQQAAVARREQATQAVLDRLGWPRRGWFLKLLRWAQATGPMREDSLYAMGFAHPRVRRLLSELGRRFAAAGVLTEPDDIYWLEEAEVEALVADLERNAALPDWSGRVPPRKTAWRAALKVTPPVILPEKSGWSRFLHGGDAERKDGKVVLKGVGASGGQVTAPACVLFGPEDFGKLRPGDVLVAVTTTPAWTPLFAQAAAVVTDIGGPLSHSSIVAREYGIPAVMAARTATRAIQTGQIITVDGSAGTVILEG